ncbi:MAG: RNA-directed DNA polymerase [Deltaproteobacteria bacterium]|nr:RNA-directed DNA polymerase [Deltaproteobacteria bacterium]
MIPFEFPFNFDALSKAFQHVKENHGRAGVDGMTIGRFEEDYYENLKKLAQEIKDGSYVPLPLLKILVDKGNGEARGLCIPTVRDRVAQTAVYHIIEPILEREFEECSFAYRKGRSVKQAVYSIKGYYDKGYRWVVEADIDAFFDSVDHGLLLEKLKRYVRDEVILRLIGLWLKAEVWDGEAVKAINKGIPQGSPISPILANLFLDELDEAFLKKGNRIIRFSDDFVVLCKNPKDAQAALEFTSEVLEKLLLKLDESDVVNFEHGFKFLGVTFVRSLIMVPFDRPKRERRVLYVPPPMSQ